MLYDRTLLGSWDTEVHNMSVNGGVATPEDNYDVFIINTSFFWHHSSEPIVNFCCVSVPMIPKEDAEVSNVVYIVCKTEKEALLANMYVLANMLPDILTAYNSTGFDWPIIREQMKRHCILKLFADSINIHERKYSKDQSPDDIYKWTFSGEKVKINAERTMELTCVAHIPGMLDIDAMVYITQLYPKTEVGRGKSLNYFLTANKLPLKEDMPYETMRKIYVQAKHNAEQGINDAAIDKLMGDVAYYCVMDCIAPQRLTVKQTIVGDKRSLASMVCMSLYSTFYKADGIRVTNYIAKNCHRLSKTYGYEIACPTLTLNKGDHEKEHYPGGHVFTPKYGIETESPVTGLDFASLYPSLMITYNLSADMSVTNAATAQKLIESGYNLHYVPPISCERGAKKHADGNAKFDVSGWFVRHEQTTIPTAPLPGQRMGIAASTVKKLFDKRVPVKQEWCRLDKIIESMEINGQHKAVHKINGVEREYTIDEVKFYYNKVNGTQKSIKLLANTTYGVLGQFRSSLYSLLVAASITYSGRESVKAVAAFVEAKGFAVKYGDTDSL
jgi:DNA polymerase elongation subunit (family B)